MVRARGKGGGEMDGSKGGINGGVRDFTLGGECTMQYKDDALQSCTLVWFY